MKARVRQATSADAGVLAALHAASFEERWPAASLRGLMAAAGAIALLGEDEGGPCGFVLARVAGDEAEILTVAVAPAARRRGMGRALVEAAAVAAGDLGAARLFLEVAVDNPAAFDLYAGLGFAEKGRRKAYYARANAAPADALILSADLPLRH